MNICQLNIVLLGWIEIQLRRTLYLGNNNIGLRKLGGKIYEKTNFSINNVFSFSNGLNVNAVKPENGLESVS